MTWPVVLGLMTIMTIIGVEWESLLEAGVFRWGHRVTKPNFTS